MQSELRAWLVEAGFPDVTDLAPMSGDLGSNELWSFLAAPGGERLVARVFSKGAVAAADRESLAMAAAAAHGLPVPEVVARGRVADRPVLVTAFVAGIPAGRTPPADPDEAHAAGRLMGEVLGRLHEIVAPPGLSGRGDWIGRAGPAIEPLRALLEAVPDQDRLLHLDYHPLNVMVDAGRISGVIDWENTLAGPPHMDLARSRAILRAIAIGRIVEPAVIDRLDAGFVEGHAAVTGPDPHPDLSAAWGLAMTADDLARQARKPGSGIAEALVSQLETERDERIRLVLEGNPGD